MKTPLPSLLWTRYAGLVCRFRVQIPNVRPALIPIVGPETMPNAELSLLALMDLNYKVNTNSKHERFILIRFSWPTSSPQATRLRFSFILDFVHSKSTPCTPLDKSPLPNVYTFSYNQENNHHLVQLASTLRRPSCTMISLMITTLPISLGTICEHGQRLV